MCVRACVFKMYLLKAYSPVNQLHRVTSVLFAKSNLTEVEYNTKHTHFTNIKRMNICLCAESAYVHVYISMCTFRAFVSGALFVGTPNCLSALVRLTG